MSGIGDFLLTDEILAELGSRLRARRLERNVTVESVATATGLNRKTILEAENGHDVRLTTWVKLLRHMDLLGALDAAIPDTLPGGGAFATRGHLRKRASKHG